MKNTTVITQEQLEQQLAFCAQIKTLWNKEVSMWDMESFRRLLAGQVTKERSPCSSTSTIFVPVG